MGILAVCYVWSCRTSLSNFGEEMKFRRTNTKTSTAQEFAGPSQWCCDFVRNTMRPMGWKARIGKGKRKGSWKCPPGS